MPGAAPAATPTALDLFCGAGGVTTGFKAAGVRVLAAVDTDPAAGKSFQANHPEVKLHADDLHNLAPRNLRRRMGMRKGELTILTACAPCQTYSTLSAKNRKARDKRNGLVGRVVDFVEEFEPAAVVMENVPLLRGHRRFAEVVRRLRKLGYGVRHEIVDAAAFGVPQRRRRLVLVAVLGIPSDDIRALSPAVPTPPRTVREALVRVAGASAGDPLNTPRTDFPETVARRIAAIPHNGGSRTQLPPELRLKCHEKLGASGSGNVYGRMRWDDVAPTLTTRCTTPACGRYLHPEEDRPITLREAAVLQSFPLDYKLEGTNNTIQAQIGNAVPPLLAQAVATLVLATLAESRPPAVATRARAQAGERRPAQRRRGQASRTPGHRPALSRSRPPGRPGGYAPQHRTARSTAER